MYCSHFGETERLVLDDTRLAARGLKESEFSREADMKASQLVLL